MPMEGSSEEYEKLTLASLKKAASPDSDATYHNNRAAIFASLAAAAASAEMAEALDRLAGPRERPKPGPGSTNGAAPHEEPAAAPVAPGTAIVPRDPA
ncbi:MAG: hypothetical protein KDB10_17245 [Acidimicrobiales bacterium]|nr:hypothetical protein [Acidimicrobiales bacterium]